MSTRNMPPRDRGRNPRGPDRDPGPDRRETVYTFAKNARERVLSSLSHYRGGIYLDLRIFYTGDDGQLHPTRKGITLDPELLEELEKAVALLRAALEARGLAA